MFIFLYHLSLLLPRSSSLLSTPGSLPGYKKSPPGVSAPVPVKWILKNNNATVSWIYHQVDLTGDFLRCLIVFLVV